jgi:hypothetical protein
MNRIILSFLLCLWTFAATSAQERTVENRPYTDLRPLHFGILVGTHLQDLEFQNVGPQEITLSDGTTQTYNISTDQDRWDNGFNVGVLAELRLSRSFQFRMAPTLYFGSRHISFHNFDTTAPDSLLSRSQTLKTIYIGCALDLIFAAERFNNHRPYIMAGLHPVVNLSNKSNDYVKLKHYDIYLEAGVGCDFYLPFFKLRPELKFMYGLTNCLDTDHPNQLRDELMIPYAKAVNKARSKMIVLTFYFE